MGKTCETCQHRTEVHAGMFEYAGEFVDRLAYECRRYPPQKTFWGQSFPAAKEACGEHQPVQEVSGGE